MYITFFQGAIIGAYQPPVAIAYGVFSIASRCFQAHAPLCFQVHVWFQNSSQRLFQHNQHTLMMFVDVDNQLGWL
jgi:hypothetical protein